MELLDYEEPTKPKQNPSFNKKAFVLFLLGIGLFFICKLDFIPSLDWLEFIFFCLFIATIFAFLYIEAPQKQHNSLLGVQEYQSSQFFGLFGCIFIIMIAFGSLFFIFPPDCIQKLQTTSGTFYVLQQGWEEPYNSVKKQYSNLPFVYELEDWNDQELRIQLDTINNIVSANGEPIWNLTTDEFIPRTTTLNR